MHNLGNALARHGHEVTIVAKRISWSLPEIKREYDLYRYSIPVPGAGKTGLDFISAILTVSKLYKRKHFDVINAHGADYSGGRAKVLRKIWGLPLVITPHGIDIQKVPEINYGLRLDDAWDRKISENLKAADYVTAISRSIHQDLGMIPENRIIDIPNGVDVERFKGPKSDYLRKKLDIDESRPIILSVGRNHIKKGYDYGIRAASRLVGSSGRPYFHYVIVGREVSEHQETVAECKAEGYVSLIDEIPPEKITQCYKSADIFFSPSIVEGLSLVSIEAMASGLPLVVTNVPGNDDVVKENGCGIIVQSKNLDDMARALFRILNDSRYRNKLSTLSSKCSVKYDWSEIAMRYESVYKIAIENQKNDI